MSLPCASKTDCGKSLCLPLNVVSWELQAEIPALQAPDPHLPPGPPHPSLPPGGPLRIHKTYCV